VPESLTMRIMKRLADIGPGTAGEISFEFGHADNKAVSARLTKLYRQKLVKRVGSGKSGQPYIYSLP